MKTVIACLAALFLTTHVAHADVAYLSCSGTYDAESEGLRTGFRRKPDSIPMIADSR